MNSLPLCVDLDGTLLKTDTLLELLIKALKQNPFLLFVLPFWLLRGKANFKAALASRHTLQSSTLPYNKEFLSFLQLEKEAGRKLYLVTGAHIAVAKPIADYCQIFTDVFATQEKNLTGKTKADLMTQTFGEKNFAYAGNDMIDRHCWDKARDCYIVNALPSTSKKMKRLFSFAGEFDLRNSNSIQTILRAIRIHQWAKNFLVFVPLLASHNIFSQQALINTLLAFFAFGCCASLSYIINDISDLDADRQHRSKNRRPFASGELSITTGLFIVIALLFATAIISLALPNTFIYCLIIYFTITNAYTLRLKHISILDVTVLAGLYTLRVIAGGYASHTQTSFWLLAFSCFVFFSLAIVKRVSELQTLSNSVAGQAIKCRGYWTSDLPVLTSLGTASAMMAVLVMALYTNNPDVAALYSSPQYLWLLCPIVALWLGRVWLITGRGEMHDDPIVFTLRDKASWLLFTLAALMMILGATLQP